MSLVYIDTNVFLDFYQAGTDRLVVFNEILDRSSSVLLTEQTVDEFYRNRVARLNQLAESIEKLAKPQIYTTAVIRELPGFESWCNARDKFHSAAVEIVKELRSWTVDPNADRVLVAFKNLVSNAKTVPTENNLIELARTRKLLGKPPTSQDKHTIGDELIWEALIQGAKDDIVVVSRDKSFLDNSALLTSEFETRTGRELLLVTDSLNKALEKVGRASEKIKIVEQDMPKPIPSNQFPFSMKCPSCGGELYETGYEGSEGDSAWWLFCSACGEEHFPP
jgi:predicted nucleic acid-binding protein